MRKKFRPFLLAASLIMATWSNRSYARQIEEGDIVLPEVVVECISLGRIYLFGDRICIEIFDCSYGFDWQTC
jgi:hypothetical protein